MRIYFLGGHGTGKTDLAKMTAAYLGYKLYTEVARRAVADTGKTLDELRTDLQALEALQRTISDEQLKIDDEAGDDFVSDRAFDNWAYAAEHTLGLGEILASPRAAKYIERVAGGLIFFVRPLLTVQSDGVRPKQDLNITSVERIDAMVQFMLEQWRVQYRMRYFSIENATPAARWNNVSNIIQLARAAESKKA